MTNKTKKALTITCPRCNAEPGVHCSLMVLTEMDPKRSERHAMRKQHDERYIASANVVLEESE